VPSGASEQGATELGFQKLDRARKRRLCDMALPRRLREVQLLADRKKISDLMDFHAPWLHYFEFSVAVDDHASSVPDWIRDPQRSTMSAAGPS
jgi:hypothetical protein